MFTWIPIHEETAKRLLEFKDRQNDLIDILARMHAAELVAIPIMDRGPDGSSFQLKEISPFLFLANFNRGIRDDNRQALWSFLKHEWNLQSPVPADFEGLPVANKMNSWFMPYAENRTTGHVPLLWSFYEHMISEETDGLDVVLMQQCIDLHKVGLAMLTMAMFWAQPRKWIAADRKNAGFAEAKGINGKLKTAADYAKWLPAIREEIGGDAVEFSRKAHSWSLEQELSSSQKQLISLDNKRKGSSGTDAYGSPFNRMFPPGEADAVLDVFADALEVVQEDHPDSENMLAITFGSTSRSIPQLVISIGKWAVLWYENRSGAQRFNFLLPVDHPEVLKQGVKSQFADEVEGKSYTHAKLPASEFLERYEELWPAIADSIRATCSRSDGWKGTPYLRFHRPELISLAKDPVQRVRILREGLSVRKAETDVAERSYWLIAPGEGARLWEQWQEQGIAAIGWPELGDLTDYNSKEEILKTLDQVPNTNNWLVALMLWNISREMKPGDIVFAKLGRSEVIGWGEVAGGYSFAGEKEEYPHVVAVDWKVKKAVKISERKLAIKALTELNNKPKVLKILSDLYPGVPGLGVSVVGDENDDIDDSEEADESVFDWPPYDIDKALSELFMSRDALDHILEQLRRKKNIILQGAPGVGKTFIAKRLAWLLLGAKDESAVEMVQFHQSYTYEDFVQGLRPTKDGHFAVKDGCFYRLCRKALANPQQEYFLVIDEINRGNLSKILGELMMLIETDKRGEALTLAYGEDSKDTFTVPPNLYLIGTMNTADRSLSLVDYALRRRFAFLTLDPGFSEKAFTTHLGNHGLAPGQISHIIHQMEALNLEIEKDETNLGKGYRIGHSFFTPTSPVPDFHKWWQSVIRYEIMPLLEEYWIDDPKMVQQFRITLTENIL